MCYLSEKKGRSHLPFLSNPPHAHLDKGEMACKVCADKMEQGGWKDSMLGFFLIVSMDHAETLLGSSCTARQPHALFMLYSELARKDWVDSN